MKLSRIGALPSFALLGPGFDAGPFALLSPLRSIPRDAVGDFRGPALIHASFETRGRDASCFGGELQSIDAPEFDVPRARVTPALECADHGAAVETIRAAIAAGDAYQVCLTVRARLPPAPGAGLLAAMCARGVPPFAAWVRLPDGTEFVSGSPERLLAIDGERIRSEPMKGTGATADVLDRSEKDRAELAMITDLVRNDLTAICRPRTVRVVDERRFVRLPYAMQTVSVVEGVLASAADGRAPSDRPGGPPADEEPPVLPVALRALDALHPGGSVTGAPKNAAMDMIRRLEPTPRGAYCGVLGLARARHAAVGLLIRTATRTADGWVFGVGSAIVHDSDPARELAEVHLKLGALGAEAGG